MKSFSLSLLKAHLVPHRTPSSSSRRLLAIACLVFVTAFGFGCASTKPMTLAGVQAADVLTKKPIGVFILRTENQHKTNYQSTVVVVRTKSEATGKRTMWRIKKPSEGDKAQYSEYWISVSLDPGGYQIDRVIGQAGDGILIVGHFDIEPRLRFKIPGSGVHYLGRVSLLSRERKEGERRSGPMVPLIDQSVTGYSNSSTDILIEDGSEADIPKFVEAYPILRGVNVTKSLITKSSEP